MGLIRNGGGGGVSKASDVDALTRYAKEMSSTHASVVAGVLTGEEALQHLQDDYKVNVLDVLLAHLEDRPKTAPAFLRYVIDHVDGDVTNRSQIMDTVSRSGCGHLLPAEIKDYLDRMEDDEIVSKKQISELIFVYEAAKEKKRGVSDVKNDNPMLSDEIGDPLVNEIGESGESGQPAIVVAANVVLASPMFKTLVIVVVFANAIIIALMTYSSLADKTWLLYMETFVLFLFCLEVAFRFLGELDSPLEFLYRAKHEAVESADNIRHHSHAWSANSIKRIMNGVQGWNCFDILILVLCLGFQSSQFSSLRNFRLVKLLQLTMKIKAMKGTPCSTPPQHLCAQALCTGFGGSLRANVDCRGAVLIIGLADGLRSIVWIMVRQLAAATHISSCERARV